MVKLITGAALLVALGLSLVWGWPRYQRHRQDQTLRQARAFIAAGDFANASLSVRQVLYGAPAHLQACRIMVELAEIARSPAALSWQERVVEISPTLPERLRLARAALLWQAPPCSLAAQTLRELESPCGNLAEFHVLSAELALKLNRVDEAALQFGQASRLEPTNAFVRFNATVLQLQSTNQARVAAARDLLEDLGTNRDLKLPALRWRIAELLRQNKPAVAAALSHELLADTRAGLGDRLQRLTLLQLARDPGLTAELRAIQALAGTNSVELHRIADWMANHGLAAEAMLWLSRFDEGIRRAQPVSLALANVYAAQRDWAGLERWLAGQEWQELEFLRRALLAQAAAGQHDQRASEVQWRAALDATHRQLAALNFLLGLAAESGRDTEDVLWEIGRRFPTQDWALRELEQKYLGTGNTRGLNKVYRALANGRGGAGGGANATNLNNFATSCLLLKINLSEAHATARDLYNRMPQDPVIGSTYGYSLHLQGRTAEGLEVFGKLKPASLEVPSIALYYGLLLAEASHPEQAARYLKLAESAPLLPEERQLLAQARGRAR